MLRFVLRSLLLPALLYCAAGLVASYFVWHGVNGQRGLKAGEEYAERLAALEREHAGLVAERKQWERRIALLRGDVIDADMLDEQARVTLGRIHRNEVVILAPQLGRREEEK
ncbi:septation inhibitor protein [Methylosinus trichosporium OB3b]|uniref:Septation inhibitor protein n=2 Tax=Methylocystaceae TaxID=31993 RepID=A0A2D2D579_METT3|nr:septation inhibitor protein [Methylosinus trichosporium OB3b]